MFLFFCLVLPPEAAAENNVLFLFFFHTLCRISLAVEIGFLQPKEISGIYAAIKRETKRFSAHLPIYAVRSELISAVQQHRVVIVRAETGSGKSTQVRWSNTYPAFLCLFDSIFVFWNLLHNSEGTLSLILI